VIACGDCINEIIGGLVLLVNRMEVTMKILVNITDFTADSEDLNRLRITTSLVRVSTVCCNVVNEFVE